MILSLSCLSEDAFLVDIDVNLIKHGMSMVNCYNHGFY